MKSDRSTATKNRPRFVIGGLLAALPAIVATEAYAATRLVAEMFTATTANMTPAGVNLRMQILEWQEADARVEVVATLVAGADAATPLGKLPTVGYIWPNGSPVGYSVKYTYHAPQPDGGEHITLVTDKPLGSYDFKGWSVADSGAKSAAPYSVIELEVNGSGTGSGSFSLVGEVSFDEQAGTVTLKDATPSLLTNVRREQDR